MNRVYFIACKIGALLVFSIGLLMLSGASVKPLDGDKTLLVSQAYSESPIVTPSPTPDPTAVPTPSAASMPVANIMQVAELTPTPSPTPVPVEVWKVIIDKSALRAGPSKKEACLALFMEGDTVQLLSGETEGWIYVMTTAGNRGYLDINQVEYAGTQTCTLTASPPEGWQELPRSVVRSCYDTVLRYRPIMDLTDNGITILSAGETVHVIGVEGLYFKVARAQTGQTGYMLSAALDLADPLNGWVMEDGIVNFDAATYTYEKMNEDIAQLTARYGDWLRVDSSGESVLGRSIPVLRLGGENTRYNILIQASIHGREFATTPLLMEQMESLLMGLEQPGEEGDALRELFGEVAVYAVPMANPDGVGISQWGPASVPEGPYLDQLLAWQQRDCPKFGTKWYNSYFPMWKSNINGVDLNRNFDARWKYSASAPAPGQLNYKGTAPLTEPESLFLADLLEQIPISAHLSYHSSGNQLFWYFRQQGELYWRTYQLAGVLKEATGYWRISAANSKGSNAGFKDYGIEKYGIPGITMEIGAGDTPLDPSQYPLIWEKNQDVIAVTAQWVLDDAAAQAAKATAVP